MLTTLSEPRRIKELADVIEALAIWRESTSIDSTDEELEVSGLHLRALAFYKVYGLMSDEEKEAERAYICSFIRQE